MQGGHKEPKGQKYNDLPITMGGHKNARKTVT